MSQEHPDLIASPFQLKLKDFCVWIENKFECRLARAPFALRMAIAAAVFGALPAARTAGFLSARRNHTTTNSLVRFLVVALQDKVGQRV